MQPTARRVIAACFALLAFAVAIGTGLASDNPALVVLWRAVMVMGLCYLLGLAVGVLCETALRCAATGDDGGEREAAAVDAEAGSPSSPEQGDGEALAA
jgi:hypothetical protein